MAKRFHSTILSLSGVSYDLEIHDDQFSGVSIEFVSAYDSVVLSYDSPDRKRNTTIMPASLSFDMQIKNITLESLITDLVGANESRFIVVLKQSANIKFVGYAITDLTEEENISYPFTFSVSAVDGLARLKSLDYNNNGTAYSGTETIEGHINNIITKIGLSAQAGTTLNKETEWTEDSHQPGADLLPNTRCNHSLFTKEDTNGNIQFSNPYLVLNEICKTFLSRFLYFDGAYHFQQLNKYKTLNTYDLTATKALGGGGWTHLPALRQSKVIFKYGDTVNIAKGVSITQDNNTGLLSGDFKQNGSYIFRGSLQYKTAFSSSFLAANGVKSHRVKFGLTVKIGSHYLKRTASTSDFYSIQNEEIEWVNDGNPHYFEIYGDVINEFNYNFNKVIQFNVVTPPYSGTSSLSTALVKIENLQILKPDFGTYSSPDIELNWTLYNAYFKEDTNEQKVVNYERVYSAVNNTLGNSKTETLPIIMGDVDVTTAPAKLEVYNGTNWEDSNAWSNGTLTGKKIGQLLADEILAGQNKNIRLLRQGFIMPTFSPLQRLTYRGDQYLFLKGDWSIERDEIFGEWIQIDVDQTTLTEQPEIIGDGTTNPTPDKPTIENNILTDSSDQIRQETKDETIRNIPISILDNIKNGKISTDLIKTVPIVSINVGALPQSTTLRQGDIVKLLHPVTGKTETITLAANTNNPTDTSRYLGGDTTLFIESFAPSVNFPIGTFLIKDTEASPTKSTAKRFKVSNYTGAFIDVDFDLPTEEDEIDKRLMVVREYGTAIFNVNYDIGNDGNSDRRRITPYISFDGEAVLVILKND